MQFSRLRISGFKSFVEPTELWIESGLTGIVGPNGCGKSNLVDSLRWVMGETSAKQMRGGEMDDVIFAGTTGRPARNLAEVTLLLDNSKREAPATFNDSDELEVTRRIDRGSGSTYFVNGREVRARDVHLLFADAATGAHSTAVVGQGHIGDLIKGKPAERRAILEEAAGITGLHARRHEAELRLRAAETNLARLEDVLTTLDTQLQALKRQARQASRYRKIGDFIRRAESILLHLRWSEATAAIEEARAKFAESQALVSELAAAAGRASANQADAAAGLPELRRVESEAAAALQRLVIERENLDAEEARVAKTRQDCEDRLRQTHVDIDRERQLASDATETLHRLSEEEQAVTAAMEGERDTIEAAAQKVAEASARVSEMESELTRLTEEAAALEARRAALERRVSECDARIARLAQRADEIARQTEEIRASAVDSAEMEAAAEALHNAVSQLQTARSRVDNAEHALFAAQGAESAEREKFRLADSEHAKLAAEAAALAEILEGAGDENLPPVIDKVTVANGYEIALGTALGDDLNAPADANARVRWQALDPLAGAPALPEGAEPLGRHVNAPAALQRRLSQIGVVKDEATARALWPKLAQGQRLVTPLGGLWRWDGFTVGPGVATAAAVRLSQKSRLGEIRAAMAQSETQLAEARASFDAAAEQARAAATALREAQENARRAESDLDTARRTHDELARRAEAQRSRESAIAEAAAALAADRSEAEADANEARAAMAGLADGEEARRLAAAARDTLAEHRTEHGQAHADHDHVVREARMRADKLALCRAERTNWQARADGAARQLAELTQRLEGLDAERTALAQRPDEIAAQRNALQDAIDAAEAKRSQAAATLADAETRLREADRVLKEEESRLVEAREARVRAEAHVEQAEQALQVVADRIEEKLGCQPEEALAAGGIEAGEELPAIDVVENRLERLLRERDNMGPVNLRAEAESADIEAQIANLRNEREDLISAISRLRQGIANLNREGRERLLAAFNEVDAHFQKLFVRLFGGGRAHMQLTDAEDPLQAGLEIFASPPGKRLQVLSLLSGGEQALTALALLFAVFLTNPAPICVLDEVDAPLDDANVDRFCVLVEEIANSAATRFMLVTHHRITMARMHRLFGVTMLEQGVSQLVSVDLADAERLRATA